MPDDQTASGNPAARSGLNYSDIGGNVGISTDNVYYFDGINVTDPVTGTFGANLNTEIIQEQKVITGGIPAEFVGAPGLISNVDHQVGQQQLPRLGQLLLPEQQPGRREQERPAPKTFSTKDSAFTFGGPMLRDKAWFFGSYRYTNREDDVSTLDTNEFMRTRRQHPAPGLRQGQLGGDQRRPRQLQLPERPDRHHRPPPARHHQRARPRPRAGRRTATAAPTPACGAARCSRSAPTSTTAKSPTCRRSASRATTCSSRRTDVRVLTDEQLGGFGRDLIDQRDNQAIRGSLQRVWRNHTFKGGAEWNRSDNFRDTLYVDSQGFTTLADKYRGAGITAAQIAAGGWTGLQFDVSTTERLRRPHRAPSTRSADRARVLRRLRRQRRRHDHRRPSSAPASCSTRANPAGGVNYDRDFQAATGPQETFSKGLSFFVQDECTFNRLTLNLGVRTERWEHFATTGENIYTFHWEFAPRLSAVYDMLGDGRHKASALLGPLLRPDPQQHDQLRGHAHRLDPRGAGLRAALNKCVTYRTRGGPAVQDAFFSPTTQTPYTDDLQFGYAVDLGNNMSFDALYFNRRTRDILEDYDLELYADPERLPRPDRRSELAVPRLDYFGYTENPGSNFVIGTLAGGERNFQGLEFVFRKRFAEQLAVAVVVQLERRRRATPTRTRNADFQGDVDLPRSARAEPVRHAAGLIRHLSRAPAPTRSTSASSWAARSTWNSGTVASRTFLASGRNLPMRVPAGEAFEFAGFTNRWLAPDAVGSLDNPSWGQVDLRAQYNRRIIGRCRGRVLRRPLQHR